MARPRLRLVLALATTLAAAPALAQPPPAAPPVPAAPAGGTAYKTYMTRVAQHNLELLAQRSSVAVAEAQIAVARIFPDPVLTAGVSSIDVSGKGAASSAPTVTTLGLGLTVELGGKRGARVAAAEAGTAVARADLDEALRAVRGTATGAFIDALYARLALDRKRQTLRSLEKLVGVNEERARAGDIGKVALTQSRVEAQRFRGEVVTAEAEVDAADLALAVHAGETAAPITPAGDLRVAPRAFSAEALVASARETRPDLRSRRRAAEGAEARADLARANRWVDPTFNVGWQHNFAAGPSSPSAAANPFAAPSYEALTATVSVPLPFSRVYRGELDAALATQAQSRTQVQATELRVDVEVRQALVRYKAAVDRTALYTGGLLESAEQVLEAMLYNYQKGGATLLEVLEAERTSNEVYLGYYAALADQARALVAVEQAAGIWDVDF